MNSAFGIDVGGSGIKGAPVDGSSGQMTADRVRIPTPQPASPKAVIEVIAQIAADHSGEPIGCALPGVVQHGKLLTATNLDNAWVGFDAERAMAKRLKRPVTLINDADAAALAEMRFGAGCAFQQHGVVLTLTFGTGIGSGLVNNGQLVPNTELGELEMDGQKAELLAAARLRESKELSWSQWTERVQQYLDLVERLFWPDLIIIGGGISKRADKFLPELTTRAEVVPAELRNRAGIIGAACAALDDSTPGQRIRAR